MSLLLRAPQIVTPSAEWNLVKSTYGETGADTPPIDTAGSDLLIMAAQAYSTPGTPADSKENTWTQGVLAIGPRVVGLWYCRGGTVGPEHVFSWGGNYGPFQVSAWSGSAVDPADQTNQSGWSADPVTSIQPGPITPSVNNSLIITSVVNDSYSFSDVDSGFRIIFNQDPAGNSEAGASAWLVQATPAVVNPIWTVAGGLPSAVIMSFKGA